MIWKKIENIYDRIVGYEYGVYPADGSEPVSHDRDIKKYNEVGKIGCRIPTVDEFCIKRIGTCWESANYFASVLPKIVGPQNFRYVYAEWPHNGHVFTHAFTIIRVNKLWYCIDTEEYGRNKKFKDINLETYTDLEDCKEKISPLVL